MKIRKSYLALIALVLLGLLPLIGGTIMYMTAETVDMKAVAPTASIEMQQMVQTSERLAEQQKDLLHVREELLDRSDKLQKAARKYDKTVAELREQERRVQEMRRMVVAAAPPVSAAEAPGASDMAGDGIDIAAGESAPEEPVAAAAAPPVEAPKPIPVQPIQLPPNNAVVEARNVDVEIARLNAQLAQLVELQRMNEQRVQQERERHLAEVEEANRKREADAEKAKQDRVYALAGTATGGLFTMLTTVVLYILRRGEKKEVVGVEVYTTVRMPFQELVSLILKSIISLKELNRLLYRADAFWSIYGMTHTALLPESGPGRPIQLISRNGTPTETIHHQFPKVTDWDSTTRTMCQVNKRWMNPRSMEIHFMQTPAQNDAIDLDAWTLTDIYREPRDVVADMKDNEVAIMFYFQRGKSVTVLTIISTNSYIPCTFKDWEDFVIAFHKQNKLMVTNSALMDIISIHRTI